MASVFCFFFYRVPNPCSEVTTRRITSLDRSTHLLPVNSKVRTSDRHRRCSRPVPLRESVRQAWLDRLQRFDDNSAAEVSDGVVVATLTTTGAPKSPRLSPPPTPQPTIPPVPALPHPAQARARRPCPPVEGLDKGTRTFPRPSVENRLGTVLPVGVQAAVGRKDDR